MANNVESFFESLTAASGDFNASTVGNLQFLQGVYLDIGTEAARNGETITVPMPDVGPWSNVGAQDWVPEDLDVPGVDLVFNQRPGKAILVHDFDQWRTSSALLEKFITPMYNRGLEYFNGLIAQQITPQNFNVNPVITASTPGTVTIEDIGDAWASLATAKTPMSNQDDLNIFVNHLTHRNMLLDKDLYQESLVGAVIANSTRQQANLGYAFGFKPRWDQQAPGTVGTFTGTVVGNGTTAVVGTGTQFTTELRPGDMLQFGADPNFYVVASIQDNTHLTMTSPVTTGTGLAIAGSGYLALAAHRYAIALAVRPLQLVNDGTVQSRLILLSGVPFRVMTSYQHLKGGYLLTMDCGAACKTIRPDFGVLINV